LANEPLNKKVDKTPGELKIKVKYVGLASPNQASPKNTDTKPKPSVDATVTPPVKKSKKPASIEEEYDMGKIIGRGAFSVVKIATRKSNKKKYAVKCITKQKIKKDELVMLEREIDVMKKLQHPNIIQLMEVVDTTKTLYLVLEFANGGDLFEAIVNRGFYSDVDAAKIVAQILEAILFTHQNGIAHRDLKPENLLIMRENDKDVIKIADFGLAKDFEKASLVTSVGTPDYVAPEVISGSGSYDSSVDIWSIGVITYVLLCGFPPFCGDTQKDLFMNIMAGNYDFPSPEWDDVSKEAKLFIQNMLVVDSHDRFNAEQCLEDPWIVDNTTSSADSKRPLKKLQSFSVAKCKEYMAKYKKENPQNVTYDEKYSYDDAEEKKDQKEVKEETEDSEED